MTSNGRPTAEGQHQPPHGAGLSDQPSLSNRTSHQQGPGGPRVIQITHQAMEPVVMMQMNGDGVTINASISCISMGIMEQEEYMEGPHPSQTD